MGLKEGFKQKKVKHLERTHTAEKELHRLIGVTKMGGREKARGLHPGNKKRKKKKLQKGQAPSLVGETQGLPKFKG